MELPGVTAEKSTRFRVVVNPQTGMTSSVCSNAMGRKSLSALEGLLRKNVQELLAQQYGNVPYRLKKRHKRVRLETLTDIIQGKGGCNVSYLGALADAFGLKPYQLLIPDLDAKEPQQVVSGKQVRLLKQIREEK